MAFVGSEPVTSPGEDDLGITAVKGVGNLSGVEAKTTTTVALDFGRGTLSPDLRLYLFGTPGQDRFWSL